MRTIPRIRFRLRTLLAGVFLVGVVFRLWGWSVHSCEWIRRRHAVIDSVYHFGFQAPTKSIRAPGGLWLLGESGFKEVKWHGHPKDLPRVRELFPESVVTVAKP